MAFNFCYDLHNAINLYSDFFMHYNKHKRRSEKILGLLWTYHKVFHVLNIKRICIEACGSCLVYLLKNKKICKRGCSRKGFSIFL